MAIYLIRRSVQTVAFVLFIWLVAYTVLVLLSLTAPNGGMTTRLRLYQG